MPFIRNKKLSGPSTLTWGAHISVSYYRDKNVFEFSIRKRIFDSVSRTIKLPFIHFIINKLSKIYWTSSSFCKNLYWADTLKNSSTMKGTALSIISGKINETRLFCEAELSSFLQSMIQVSFLFLLQIRWFIDYCVV